MQGNTGRNAFRGPGLTNADLSLARTFGVRWLGESGRLTIRADAFNALNTTQFGIPGRTLGNADFGQISSTYPARNIQLALRYAF